MALLDSLTTLVTPHMASQIAEYLDVQDTQVPEGIKLGGPLLLNAIAHQAETPEQGDAVLAKLKHDDADALGNVMGIITSGAGEDLANEWFGAGLNKVAATIHDATGFEIAPYLPVVTPMVLGIIQHAVKTNQLDGAGLSTLLKNETDEYAKAEPLLSQQLHIALEAGDQVVANATKSRARFTDAEWDTLTKAPSLAGFAVMMSSLNGPFGMTQEIVALTDAMFETMHEAPGDSLVALVSREFKDPDQLNALGANHENAEALALEDCKQAVVILNEKATPQEQYEYKQLVLNAAQRVAHAAKEGGFLGIGGVEVNADEQAMLDKIADALGFKP